MTPIWRRKRRGAASGPVLFVAERRGAGRGAARRRSRFSRRTLRMLPFPAWDCLPYDRVSPKPDIESARLATLGGAGARASNGPAVIVTTVNAVLQRVPPRAAIAEASFAAKVGEEVDRERWSRSWPAMAMSGPARCAIPAISRLRGGIVDLWPPGTRRAAAAGFLRRDPGSDPPIRCRDAIVRRDSVDEHRASARQRSAARREARSAASAPAMSRPSGRRATIRSMKASAPAARRRAWSIGCRCSTTSLDTLFDYLPRCAGAAGPSGGGGQDGAAGTGRRLL